MTRKDYQLVSDALAKCGSLGQENLLYVADMVANDIKKSNPAFDVERFIKNAGVTDATIELAKS